MFGLDDAIFSFTGRKLMLVVYWLRMETPLGLFREAISLKTEQRNIYNLYKMNRVLSDWNIVMSLWSYVLMSMSP